MTVSKILNFDKLMHSNMYNDNYHCTYEYLNTFLLYIIRMFTRNLESFQMSANNSDCINLKSNCINYEKINYFINFYQFHKLIIIAFFT